MLDRYLDGPNISFKNGKYSVMNNMCYAEFLAYYYLDLLIKDQENDNQQIVLSGEFMEENSAFPFPSVIPLMSSKEKLKCRKTRPWTP